MKAFNLTVKSKDKKSLKKVSGLFSKKAKIKLNHISFFLQKKVKKNRFSILASPHVNKTAQEQFERKFFKKQFIIQSIKNFKYLIFIKKLNINLLPNANICLKSFLSNRNTKKLSLAVFSFKNYHLIHYFNAITNAKSTQFTKEVIFTKNNIKNLLKIADVQGEARKYCF